MGSRYQRKFSGHKKVEGSDLLLQIIDQVEQDSAANAPYDAGFMMGGAGGHAMTAIEVLRKN